MLLSVIGSKWLITNFVTSTLIRLLQFIFMMFMLSAIACYIWMLTFLIDIVLMSFLRDSNEVQHHKLPRFSFEGCQYEPFVNTIRENIAVYLASDMVTAEMTAESLDGMLPANQYLKYPDAFVPSSVRFAWRVWETIAHFAFQIPHDHIGQEKLVELIVALSKRPAVLVRHEDTLLRFWDAMPHYDLFVAVYGNMFFFDNDGRHTGDKTHQTNLMAFLARVQATGLPHGLMFGAGWSLHKALEEKRLDVLLWATLWIEHCGEYLWWFVSQESNNGVIFTKQMWMSYMRRFDEMACNGQNGRYVRLLAQGAFRTMTRLTASTPNPKFDNMGQQRWEAILAREGPQGVFEEPIAPDMWVEEEEDEEEEVYWVWDGEDYVLRNNPATGLPVPTLGFPVDIDARLKRLGYDHAAGLEYDWGDCAHAWYVLGLDQYVPTATAPVPSQADFENYCQCLLAKVPTIVSVTGVSNNRNTRRRYRMILMAIKTLSGHQRTHLNEVYPDDWTMSTRFPQADDLNLRGLSWNVHMARTISSGATLPLLNTKVFRSQSAANISARQARRRQYKATQRRVLCPTAPEASYNQVKIREAEWEFANRHTDFTVQDDAGRNHFVTVVPCCRDFNNSLWHALSYQINGPGLESEKSWQGLRGGRREKAWLYNYFMSALIDPTHIRHRAYTWMQQNEKTTSGTQADKEILTTWGELSILRALATNRPHAGRAKWPAFPGIFQLISDFFRMEVIVFVGSKGLSAPPVPPKRDEKPLLSSWRLPYPYHVFGKHEYGASRGSNHGQKAAGNGQLFFVTDNEWQHFDAVRFPKFSATDATDNFDTSKTGDDHRYGNRNFPFFACNLTGKYAGGQLPDIPAPRGPAMGPSGRVWCPADDKAWRLQNAHPFVQCCQNDWDIVDARGNGQMPRLPTLDSMSRWGVGVPIGAPPMNVAPSAFEPWLVTSGGYYPGSDRTKLPAAGIFHDNVTKSFYDAFDTLNAQGHQAEAGDGVQEPDELGVIAGNPHIQYGSYKRMRRE